MPTILCSRPRLDEITSGASAHPVRGWCAQAAGSGQELDSGARGSDRTSPFTTPSGAAENAKPKQPVSYVTDPVAKANSAVWRQCILRSFHRGHRYQRSSRRASRSQRNRHRTGIFKLPVLFDVPGAARDHVVNRRGSHSRHLCTPRKNQRE